MVAVDAACEIDCIEADIMRPLYVVRPNAAPVTEKNVHS
jgi:hypothetical protein